MNRRVALRNVGLGLATLPFLKFLIAPQKSFAAGSAVRRAAVKGPWATGGTSVMQAIYPSPFTAVTDAVCPLELTCSATLGPCYGPTELRRDISEGRPGIPVRLAFRILNDRCVPIEGATIDIWHTAASGLYSGAETSNFCTLGDADAKTHNFFRGVQSSDADGIVIFDSCFPGWYSSRTIHIHFTIRVGDTEFVTSQFAFADDLVDDIVANYGDYSNRGPRDTTNQNDTVFSADEVDDYTFDVQRMDDGVMLASRTIIIRSSTGDSLCSIAGSGGGGGPGGPGGGGPGGPAGPAGPGGPGGFPGGTPPTPPTTQSTKR